MKTFTLLMASAISVSACTMGSPVIMPDSQNLCAANPGIGAGIFATPNSQWLFGFNDNFGISGPGQPGGDYDFNDAMGIVEFSAAFGGSVLENLTFTGGTSADDNDVRLSGAWLEPGQTDFRIVPADQLTAVEMLDKYTGHRYSTGGGNAWVSQVVPEPSAFLLFGGGLMALGLLRRKR